MKNTKPCSQKLTLYYKRKTSEGATTMLRAKRCERSGMGAGLTQSSMQKGIGEDFLKEVTVETRTERHGVNSQVKDNREKSNSKSRGRRRLPNSQSGGTH